MKNYFSAGEITCPCGCGLVWEENFHMMINMIRHEVGSPMVVTSGARCEVYDHHVGGKGPHTTGKAGDFQCSGKLAHRILSVALHHGINGIGVSQKGSHNMRFLHLDMVESDMRPWVWSYA